MARDRVTELRIKGMRTLADVTLQLDGLTVLIGDNGTGKSTIVEACEILRRAAYTDFGDEIHRQATPRLGALRRDARVPGWWKRACSTW